jgi:hypothetical protein
LLGSWPSAVFPAALTDRLLSDRIVKPLCPYDGACASELWFSCGSGCALGSGRLVSKSEPDEYCGGPPLDGSDVSSDDDGTGDGAGAGAGEGD